MGICKPSGRALFVYSFASMKIPQIKDIDVKGKRVLVRVDFNVSLSHGNVITNDKRIRESLPTIQYLVAHGATAVLLSHLGRPMGKADPSLSLAHVSGRLSDLLGLSVVFMKEYLSQSAAERIKALSPGSVVLCENVRFQKGEEQNDPAFAKKLALLGELFVNDAFGTAHRTHASTVGVTAYLPSYAGFLFAREIQMIAGAVEKPKRPL